MEKRAPASPISPELQQLWEAFCSSLMKTEAMRELYTQGVTGSGPAASRKCTFGGCKQFDILVVKA